MTAPPHQTGITRNSIVMLLPSIQQVFEKVCEETNKKRAKTKAAGQTVLSWIC